MIGRATLGFLLQSLFIVPGHIPPVSPDRAAPEDIDRVAWSADGSRIATRSRDDHVRLWDPASGAPVGNTIQHASRVSGGVFDFSLSPDSHQLATTGHDTTVRIWNAANGEATGVALRLHSPGFCLAWSPDGRQIAIGTKDGWELWDASHGTRLHDRSDAPRAAETGYRIAFSPDGARFAVGGLQSPVNIVTVSSGAVLPVTLPELKDWAVRTLAWRRDGGRLAIVVAGTSIRFVDPATGAAKGPTLSPGRLDGFFKRAAAWNNQGNLFASRSARGASIWNAVGGDSLELAREIPLIRGADDLMWSPDGTRLLVLHTEYGPTVVDAATGSKTYLSNRHGIWTGMQPSWSPDGRRVAFGEGDQLKIVDVPAP